ncbi:MAG: VanZ family protein [bacterium]|nr:VanZ family protein [bacterium]
MYAIEALKEILFPIPVDGVIAQDFAAVDFWAFANFVPLKDLFGEVANRGQIIRNVLVAIPFGFGAWFVFRRPTATRVTIAGFAASLLVETAQLGIGGLIGFMYRVVDVNDLILNTLGFLIGIAMFAVFGVFFTVYDRWIGSPDGRYWSYIRDTVEAYSLARARPRRNSRKQATTRG